MRLIGTLKPAILIPLLMTAGCAAPEPAPKASVKPGINKQFKGEVHVEDWVKRFEGDSREIFKHRRKILAAVDPRPGMTVADIGAGTGFFTRLFADAVRPGGKVYAVDISPDFLAHIDRLARERGMDHITTVRCRDDAVDLPPASIDLAFICDTYHHFEFPHSTMRSLHRAMKPNGELVIIDFNRHPERMTHLSADHRNWIQDHVRIGRAETIREVTADGFVHIDGPPTPYLEENYLLRFRKGS